MDLLLLQNVLRFVLSSS